MDNNLINSLRFQLNTLKVNEIFASIQGEGINTGVPSIFIRLSLCNLSCKKCDTPYTWCWQGTNFDHSYNIKYDPKKEIKEMTSMEVLDEVKKLADKKGWNITDGYTINHVVITGGEPLIHDNKTPFINLIRLLKQYRFYVEIETNGTIMPSESVLSLTNQFNVSPKLSSFGSPAGKCIKLNVLEQLAKFSKVFFKFVITDSKDIDEILDIQSKCKIGSNNILLMPEGRTDEETRERSQELVKLCLDNGYKFCNRLHIWIWDGITRGV